LKIRRNKRTSQNSFSLEKLNLRVSDEIHLEFIWMIPKEERKTVFSRRFKKYRKPRTSV